MGLNHQRQSAGDRLAYGGGVYRQVNWGITVYSLKELTDEARRAVAGLGDNLGRFLAESEQETEESVTRSVHMTIKQLKLYEFYDAEDIFIDSVMSAWQKSRPIAHKGYWVCLVSGRYRVKNYPKADYAVHHGSFGTVEEAIQFIDNKRL